MAAVMDPSGFALASVFGAVAGAVPDQEVMVWRDRRVTYAEMDRRADGLAHFLVAQGLGSHTPREELPGHLSGQDHLAIFSRNRTEYLEALIGSYRARVVPFNVNYRYVVEELTYLFDDADARAVIFSSEFAPEVAQLREQVPGLRVLVQIPDESENELLPGAVWWSDALATPAPAAGMPTPTGDDVFMMYTGGTTGMPKGVLWRQDDVYVSSMGGTPFGTTEPFASYEAIATHAASGAGRMTLLVVPPFMHAAAQWSTFHMITGGGTIVLPDNVH
ncbi:AMP-binding protein, partial [Nocardioides sp. R-C-SC26]|uniref:AMP-binding protein n=1 Tax=Nocardioides sp. R-C-SC26 TaxID=2870414 RepID=UPI001E2F9515